MTPLLGLMLINPSEIVVRIYQSVEENSWHILFHTQYPVPITNAKFPDPLKTIEVLANAFAEATAFGVGEWKITTRCFDPKITKDLSQAINIKIEQLSIEKEYDYIMKGLLKEAINQKNSMF